MVRVNVHDAVGGALVRRFRVAGTPTYLVVSPAGEVVYKKAFGFPDKDAIKAAAGLE